MRAALHRERRSGGGRVGPARLGTGLLAACLVLAAAPAGARPGVVPSELFAVAAGEGRVRVIAGLALPVRPEGELPGPAEVAAQRAGIASAQSRLLSGLAGSAHRVTRQFASIPFIALEVSPAALAALESHELVTSVQEDVAEPPRLAQSAPLVEATAAWAAGLDGGGQVVAVLDTGADASHPMLDGKIVAEACFSDGRDCPNGKTTDFSSGAGAPCSYAPQDCNHGTHVSGIAVGNGPSLDGVARGSGLIPIQVFSRFNGPANCGFGNSPCALSHLSDQIMALEHVLSLQSSFAIAAANMSLGGAVSSSPCDGSEAARKAAIDNLRSVGIATVIASGNNGDSDGISTPACISTAVSVGSTSKSDVVSSFSNSDTFLSLLAPGQSIQSALLGGGTAFWSGTSMATPHVSGAWAIVKQHVPSASVSDVLAALQTTGVPVTDARNGVTTSRIRTLMAAGALACLDADGDGVCDADDLCPGFDDTQDADADGTPDGCDVCPLDPFDDADGDGVCGDVDICPGFDDAQDADADGTPDGCDVCPLDPFDDADGDGVCGDVDVCPGFDDAQDTDADSTPDGCDEDDDNDGLPDGVETQTGVFVSASDTGTDPLVRDTDGDGHDDGAEVAAGSDPNDPASRPQVPVPLLGGAGRLLLALVLLASGSLARRLSRAPTGAKG